MAGTLVVSTLSDGTNSTSATNAIQGSAKAWVNFAGATGTRNASYNVSSVTRNSTGYYTVNFTSALSDTNYVTTCNIAIGNGNLLSYYESTTSARTTSAVSFYMYAGGAYDPFCYYVAVFR